MTELGDTASASVPARPAAGGVGAGTARILLLEDDLGLAEEVIADLVDRGYHVTHRETGRDALATIRNERFDLLVLDRIVPDLDGLTLVAKLREEAVRTPILMISALSAVDERVRGLKAGGDDYLAKPFALVELAARVEALLRRPADTRETVIRFSTLELDLIDRSVRRSGRVIELLPREFKLLEYLLRRAGQVVTRDVILEDVWHYRFIPQTNLVDVHIGKLRRKIDLPGEPQLIHSIRGSGFTIRVAP